MAATMDNLEELTNDALRLRLLEYGFANMPVTTTTRNVLIKKLRNAIDATESKTRRQTVNVAKYSSEESESEAETKKPSKTATNRRATIAAPALNNKKEPRPLAKATMRRSGRTTPLVVSNQPAASLVEHSDDELPVAAIQPPPAAPAVQRNKSRSPSLGKSALLTTSYKQVVQAPVIEESENDDSDIVVLDDENGDSSYNDEPELPLLAAPITKPSVKQSTLTASKTVTTNISRTPPRQSAGLSNLRTASNVQRLTIGGPAAVSGSGSATTFRSSSPQVSALFGNYDAAAAPLNANTAYKRRYTTNTSSISSTTGQMDDDDLLDKHTAPFLSDFTRRLAELKADPLAGGGVARGGSPSSTSTMTYRTSSTNRDYYRSSYGDRAVTSAQVQRDHQHGNTSVVGAFVNFLRSCERTIRLPLLILFLVLATVFIYVMLYQ